MSGSGSRLLPQGPATGTKVYCREGEHHREIKGARERAESRGRRDHPTGGKGLMRPNASVHERVWMVSHWPDEDDARVRTLGIFSSLDTAHAAVKCVLGQPGFTGSPRSDFSLEEHAVDELGYCGVFSSLDGAWTARARLGREPGYATTHLEFGISEYLLNRLHWASGFRTVSVSNTAIPTTAYRAMLLHNNFGPDTRFISNDHYLVPRYHQIPGHNRSSTYCVTRPTTTENAQKELR